MTNLSQIKAGNKAVIKHLECDGALRQRFIDMGLFKGTNVKVNSFAPLGDPMIIEVNDCKIAIRKNEAQKIIIQ